MVERKKKDLQRKENTIFRKKSNEKMRRPLLARKALALGGYLFEEERVAEN